ncbi:MAG TPA: hypothetical protein C5S51_01665 [Methanosarcinaceae archaeon]|nr:hypothetical protein [Methanosarcinaceae archaeon]
MSKFEDMGKDELLKIINKLVSVYPENFLYLTPVISGDVATGDKVMQALDNELRSKLHEIEHNYAYSDFADNFARFIKINEDLISKEQIFYTLKFLVNNAETYGSFYEDYSDDQFGDEIFENLCDAFCMKDLEDGDFEKLEYLEHEDDYNMIVPFFDRMIAPDNAVRLKDYYEHISKYLNDFSYIDFLINASLTEKAKDFIKSENSMGESIRFNQYLRIDKDEAIEFAQSEDFYFSLINYYHENGAYDKVVTIFEEHTGNKAENEPFVCDPWTCKYILDSLIKCERKNGVEKLIRSLFDICYSFTYFGICVDVGIELGDKHLLHNNLIDKKTGYFFDTSERIKLLDYLRDDFKEDVGESYKELAESLVEEKNNFAYKRAANCVFKLRSLVEKGEWNTYVKELYLAHHGKINFWKMFKEKGIYLKTRKGIVTMEEVIV